MLPQADVGVLLADDARDVQTGSGGVEEDGLNADGEVRVHAVRGGAAGRRSGDDFADGVRAQKVRFGDEVVRVPHVFGSGGEERDGGLAGWVDC